MRLPILFLLTLFFPILLKSQTIISQRVADLKPEGYAIQGDASLVKLDDGSLNLRLSEDFTTPRGPDVRILLGNALSLDGAVEIVDLTEINHFSGALSLAVPADIELEQYNFVIFYCVAFRALWASGELGEVLVIGEEATCAANTVQIDGIGNSTAICPDDGQADLLSFSNTLNLSTDSNYVYLLTDENDILQEVISQDLFDFEGSGSQTQRLYGLHYNGVLDAPLGANISQATASECHLLSSNFISITKSGCAQVYECMESATATTNWVTEVEICPEDGNDDLIVLKNNGFIAPGAHYAYLLTDTNEILQAVIWDTLNNFEGSGLEEQRIYGIHFDGTLTAMIGQHRTQTTADACFQHSSSDLFLTIKKGACPVYECQESLTATHDWVTEVDVCSNDGLPDAVFLQNNLFMPPGTNYTFLLTDANEILQKIITDTTYNFEDSGEAEQRVYGLNFAGELLPKIGEHRRNTTASECYIHSGDNLFIRINKTAACAITSTFNQTLANQVRVFPNPVQDLLKVELPQGFNPEQIEVFDLFGSQRLMLRISNNDFLEIDISPFSAGTYLLRMSNAEHFVTKRIVVTK